MAYLPEVVVAQFPLSLPFTAVERTVIPYPDSAKLILGDVPSVEVYYRQPNGEYSTTNTPNTLITFTGDAIEIEHGYVATGIVKVF